MIWKERIGHELYVFRNGELVYKVWFGKNGKRCQPSLLFNINGWPNEWLG
jgi:hypothetical protein